MRVNDGTVVELERDVIEVITPGEDAALEASFKARLVDYKSVRTHVMPFVAAVAARTALTASGHVCSRCGVCCRRARIEVTAQDVFRLARRLSYTSDEAFRADHLQPGATWNAEDGLLKKTEDGACVFLESDYGGVTTRCRVYEDRPASCVAFAATDAGCVKDALKLVQHLRRISVSRGTVRIVNDQDQTFEVPLDGDLARTWEPLYASLVELDVEAPTRLARVMTLAREAIAGLETRILSTPPARLSRDVESVRQSVTALQDLCSLKQEDSEPLLELWPRVARLEAVVRGEIVLTPPDAEVEEEAAVLPPSIQSITLQPEGLMVQGPSGHGSARLADVPHLAPLVREVMRALVSTEVPQVRDALAEDNPPCFLCGECCRVYAVEIHPYDVERLSANLQLTEAEVMDRYTTPGIFSWNTGSRILNKRENRECVFLEQREDGLYYCGIHPFKPDVCRAYPATASLCRKTNQLKHWPRMVTNVAFVILAAQQALLQTRRLLAAGRPALTVPYDAAMRAAVAALAEGISSPSQT